MTRKQWVLPTVNLELIGLTMRSVTWNRFPIQNSRLIPCLCHLWSEATWIQICASLNNCKKMKAEPSWLIPRKPIENVELLFVSTGVVLRDRARASLPVYGQRWIANYSKDWVTDTVIFCVALCVWTNRPATHPRCQALHLKLVASLAHLLWSLNGRTLLCVLLHLLYELLSSLS